MSEYQSNIITSVIQAKQQELGTKYLSFKTLRECIKEAEYTILFHEQIKSLTR